MESGAAFGDGDSGIGEPIQLEASIETVNLNEVVGDSHVVGENGRDNVQQNMRDQCMSFFTLGLTFSCPERVLEETHVRSGNDPIASQRQAQTAQQRRIGASRLPTRAAASTIVTVPVLSLMPPPADRPLVASYAADTISAAAKKGAKPASASIERFKNPFRATHLEALAQRMGNAKEKPTH